MKKHTIHLLLIASAIVLFSSCLDKNAPSSPSAVRDAVLGTYSGSKTTMYTDPVYGLSEVVTGDTVIISEIPNTDDGILINGIQEVWLNPVTGDQETGPCDDNPDCTFLVDFVGKQLTITEGWYSTYGYASSSEFEGRKID